MTLTHRLRSMKPSQSDEVGHPRVLALHRYFWPDAPPYASTLRAIAEHWIAGGRADVEVISAQPSYREGIGRRATRELLGRLPIHRVAAVPEGKVPAAKLLNLFVFPITAGAAMLRADRPDVMMCSTAPQVTLGAVVSLVAKWRRARFIYHCMDLHPEIGRLSGEFANPVVYRLLMAADTATMRRAHTVVVLSQDMKDAVVERDPALGPKVRILNNFELPEFEDKTPEPPLPEPDDGTVRVVFTGNIGRFQGLDTVMRGLAAASDSATIEFVLMGGGVAKDELEHLAEELTSNTFKVRFVPQGSPAEAKALMRTSHLGVVSLQPEVIKYAYPSKTATYAGVGLPVLVICEEWSEITRTVEGHGLGWAAWSEQAIAAEMRRASATLLDPAALTALKDRVRDYAASEFDERTALRRWDALLDEVTDASAAHG